MRGQVIAGKYELHSLVGHGGMGSVWRATDLTLQRQVAVKLMAAKHLRSSTSRGRFEREARALASLQNPHVVQIYDYGVTTECPYIVMELLDGESLESKLARASPLSPNAVLELLRQITQGLTAAAAMNMVHRDLKPDNVFLVTDTAGEVVKLLDFGLAWMRKGLAEDEATTRESEIVGTPSYMSPEGLRGYTPALTHDLWSVGIIAYRALTGRLPFSERYLGKLIVSICTDPAPRPSSLISGLSVAIDDFFERALAKDPKQRFGSAAQLLEAFAAACRESDSVKILVVDDEPDMAELIRLRFRKQIRARRYEFVFANNGLTALEELRHHADVDVILADINMPKMDGLTLLGKIPEVAPSARTIMVSAYSDMGNIRHAMNSGAFDFVVKPIDFTDLGATIKKTARVVSDHRKLEASDQENRVLRKLTSATMLERINGLGASALVSPEAADGTVLFVRLPPATLDHAHTSSPTDTIRLLNAYFEVIVPEIEHTGGSVTSFDDGGVSLHYTGRAHLHRALEMCRRMMTQVANLAKLAGSDSPYAQRLAIGLCSGPLTLGCLGSHTCGRLSFATIGVSTQRARQLATLAKPGEVLAPTEFTTMEGLSLFFLEFEDERHKLAEACSFDWKRNSNQPGYIDPEDPERTLGPQDSNLTESIVGFDSIESFESDTDLGALAFGWTLSET